MDWLKVDDDSVDMRAVVRAVRELGYQVHEPKTPRGYFSITSGREITGAVLRPAKVVPLPRRTNKVRTVPWWKKDPPPEAG